MNTSTACSRLGISRTTLLRLRSELAAEGQQTGTYQRDEEHGYWLFSEEEVRAMKLLRASKRNRARVTA